VSETLREKLVAELLEAFIANGYIIKGAFGDPRYPTTLPLSNDGYGDQRSKRPSILAFDSKEGSFVIGTARTTYDELSTEESLTEYDVFLDQTDPKTGKPFRLFVILPSALVVEFNALIHHYIHREYWHRIVVVESGIQLN
jgi:hypothetical protein